MEKSSVDELNELLTALQDYQGLIPDEVTDYFLKRAGFQSPDPRVYGSLVYDLDLRAFSPLQILNLKTKLIGLAVQKFISEVAESSSNYAKVRLQDPSQRRKDKKVVLTMDDLGNALKEYGMNVEKVQYLASKPGMHKDPRKK